MKLLCSTTCLSSHCSYGNIGDRGRIPKLARPKTHCNEHLKIKLFEQKGVPCDTPWHTTASMVKCFWIFILFFVCFVLFWGVRDRIPKLSGQLAWCVQWQKANKTFLNQGRRWGSMPEAVPHSIHVRQIHIRPHTCTYEHIIHTGIKRKEGRKEKRRKEGRKRQTKKQRKRKKEGRKLDGDRGQWASSAVEVPAC